jgi:hypothetical protein
LLKKLSCPTRLTALNLDISAVPTRDGRDDAAIENARPKLGCST